MNIRLFFVMILSSLIAVGCGDDPENSDQPSAGGIPESICPMESHASTSASFRPLDHDGGHSDLKLEWETYRQQGYACSGQYDFTLRATNVSQHSDGHRVWFTMILYHGDEYVKNIEMSPRGITIPVGATQDFNLHLDIDEAFESAPDGREITAAIIIQTDNPNWSDPDAFFTRTWLRLLPASDCTAEPKEQPARNMISIYSETCKGNTVKLQTHSSMLDGFPQSEVVSGPILLNGTPYEEGGFFWQSTHIADHIQPGTWARVDMFSNERDRIRFKFTERVDCAWIRTPIHPPKDDDGDDDDTGGGDGGDDGGSVPVPEPEEPGDGDEIVDRKPDQTVEEDFVKVSACGASLPGSVVPPAAGPVTGRSWKEIEPEGKTHLYFDLEHLPETTIGEGSNGWVQGVEQGEYVAWLIRQDGDRTHMLPVKAFLPDVNATTRLAVEVDRDGVTGLDGSPGMWVDADGNLTEATGVEPLSAYKGFVITLQPAGDLLRPNGMVMGGGWIAP